MRNIEAYVDIVQEWIQYTGLLPVRGVKQKKKNSKVKRQEKVYSIAEDTNIIKNRR